MKLLTAQSLDVLSIIEEDEIYYANNNKSLYYSRTPECYKSLSNKIDGNTPIFAWNRIIGAELDFSRITREKAESMAVTNECWIILDVPDSYVVLTDFYDYADNIWAEEHGEEATVEEFGCKLNYDDAFIVELTEKYDDRDIQAILPFIKKEWIVEVFIDKKEKERLI